MKKYGYYLINCDGFEKALDLERIYRYEEAAEIYESIIWENQEKCPPTIYSNLAFIYWRASMDLEPSDSRLVYPYFLSQYGGDNYMKVLNEGQSRFPDNLELRVIEKYFNFKDDGVKLKSDSIFEMMEKYKDHSEYTHIYLLFFVEGEFINNKDLHNKYLEGKEILLNLCKEWKTCKHRYIETIIS